MSIGYAYIDGKWRKCDCPYTEFAGCSERELHLLTEELRKRNHITSGREQTEMTQKQLATFRRENTDIETVLRQQRYDRETRAALVILEGGRKTEKELLVQALAEDGDNEQQSSEASKKSPQANPYDNLLVFKRIRL